MKKIIYLLIHICYSNTVTVAQEPTLMLPIGHTAQIKSATYSSNGKYILTASIDKTVKLWETSSGKLLYSLEGDASLGLSANFTHDDKYILLTSTRVAKIWQTSTGKLLHSIKTDGSLAQPTRFSSSGKFILQAFGKTIRIWESSNGQQIYSLEGHSQFINVAKFSNDEKYIASASIDNTAKIWDRISGKLLHTLSGHIQSVISNSFSADGKYIVTSSIDKTVKIWETSTGKLLRSLEGDSSLNQSVSFSTDGKYIVLATALFKKIWEISTGKLIYSIEENDVYGVPSAFFSPDGKHIITASDKAINLREFPSGKLTYLLKGNARSVNSANFSPNGKYITTTSGASANIWEIASGKLLHSLEGHTSSVNSINFSPDGNYFITSSAKSVEIWERFTGKLVRSLKTNVRGIYSANFLPNGKHILVAGWPSAEIWESSTGRLLYLVDDFSSFAYMPKNLSPTHFSADGKYMVNDANVAVCVWEVATGKVLYSVGQSNRSVISARFSPDGKYLVTSSFDMGISVLESGTGKLVQSFGGPSELTRLACLSQDGKYIAAALYAPYSNIAKIWESSSGKLLHTLEGHTGWITAINFIDDGRYIATTSQDGRIKVWESSNGKLLYSLEAGLYAAESLNLITTGKYIIAAFGKVIKVWEMPTGKLLHSMEVNTGNFNSIDLSADEKYIVSGSSDSKCIVWDMRSGRKIYTSIVIDSSDYFTQVPSGYYQCSPNAAKLLYYVTKGLKVLTFEQLDVKYNRPDKVLESVGSTDTALINAYRAAYYKRIKKLGIDTVSFSDGYSVPEADFINRNEIEYEQKNKDLILRIKGIDSTYKLDRFNVWVNEVPVFGLKGISIKWHEAHNFDTTVTISLSHGENRIETSITNINGTESYRIPLFVNYLPEKPERELSYFIGIGIDNFTENQYNLHYSVKDIRDLSLKFKEKYKGNIHIDTLYNEKVTVSNIKALKEILKKTTENDKVIISYSGHGLFSKEYDYYLSTYNINFREPEQNGLSYDDLEGLLDGIPARKKLLLIDACHSGEVDKEEMYSMAKIQKELDPMIKGFYTYIDTTTKRLGMKNSFDLMQQLFVNVGKNTGTTIISAAAGTQFALERDDLENGVFTYSILESMKKYQSMKVNTLKQIVGKRVEELTKGLQKPTFRFKTIYFDWKIW